MNNDWRINDHQKYLHGIALKKTTFKESAKNDHEHCELCWEKFSNNDGDAHEGYCTLNNYYWICEECFKDFCDLFNWTIQQ